MAPGTTVGPARGSAGVAAARGSAGVAAMARYLSKPRTLAELVEHTGRSIRTVHRWLAQIPGVARAGITRPTRYQVIRSD